MTKDELKATLIEANKTRQTPRTNEEIDAICAKFQKTVDSREAYNLSKKSDRSKIYDIVKDFEPGSYRLFSSDGMGLFVLRTADNKAIVSFSFLNPKDGIEATDARSYKLHALLNYKLNKYTYTVDWKGRSEFAIYDAFVANHKNFPGNYKNLSIGIFFDDYV